jgi:pantoate--beta-alanine ligase
MELVETISDMITLRGNLTDSVGFVPTMGCLHDGHLSLVKKSSTDNHTTVVSIFVNPTQFGPKEDFKTYPRNMERDLALLKKRNTDIVFMPASEEIYPQGFSSWVDVQKITDRLEGEYRPGHFKGVTTVVAKLFNIVRPTRAYFGQKDAQQALVIKKMVIDLNMNIDIIVAPTIREKNGLAMSSRNTYLNPQERQASTVLFKALTKAQQLWKSGNSKAANLRQEMISIINQEPLAEIQYISIADAQTLEELGEINRQALISLAVKIGKTRLIDNFVINHLQASHN